MKFDSRRSPVMARNGMVSTTQPLGAMAGIRVLMGGGNAVDAAVATAAALNVVEPLSTGVGGDMFALVRMAHDGQVTALNASGRSAAAASLDELVNQGMDVISDQSPYAITVPGAVSGWQAIIDRYGNMGLADVLKPAIEYAEDGFPVSEIISRHWDFSAYRLEGGPGGPEMLLNGKSPKPGDVFQNPTLAETLRTVAEGGAKAFYNGPIAEKIANFVQKMGGWITTEDMADHYAEWVEPSCTSYRGFDCWQVPPPTQGLNTLMALNIAEGFDLADMGYQSVDAYHHLIESMRLSFGDAMQYIADPAHMNVASTELLSKRYAATRRAMIDPNRAQAAITSGKPPSHPDTVYLTCVDGDGNACSFINSVYMGFGTGLVVPTTGIALHNRGSSFVLDPEHANALAPRKRPFHTLIPGMVTRNDELWASYGVMGSMQQAQGHLQVISNMVDFDKNPQEALNAPRFSVRFEEGIFLEDLVTTEVVKGLQAKGHPITVREPHGIVFGSGQIIRRDPESGVLTGGSEPRADGAAIGW
ncbi:MAG TPA: gamma-glutamyltransferase [Dehalococcoidia bacterium]|nr:gamma-glutamyltransferase [Dehalococcoidia bacterium]